MRLLVTAAFATLFAFTSVNAQNNWCGTDQFQEELVRNNPALKSIIEKQMDRTFSNAQNSGNSKSGNLITIPVVVHNLHDNGSGYISDKQIEDGIRVLNEDFQRLNSDTNATRSVFRPYASNVGIQFKLARIDPNGKGTNGIVRINTPLTENAGNNVKSLSVWPSNRYLNVWIVRSIATSGTGVILGYAQFPYSGINSTYGIVQRSDTWGTIEVSNSDGRTATHEVGHCLGLLHTFQNGCGSNCASSGDRICDTPPVRESTQGCNTSLNSCSNDASGAGSPFVSNVVNQIENYMSYDDCQNMFTAEQSTVMNDVITTFTALRNLTSQPNLVNTGTDSNHVKTDNEPIAEFIYPDEVICENMMVTYRDISYNGSIGTRTWTFPGGTPSTSSDSIVTVTYATAGTYDATLTVSNALGTDTKTHNAVVQVRSGAAKFSSWFYTEGLEDNQFEDNWSVINNGGNAAWEITTEASYSGDRSVYIDNFSGNQLDAVDEFLSPSFDLNSVVNPELFFKVAYKRRISSNADALRVYYSLDCGDTWVIRFARTGQSLETAESSNTPFVPQSEEEWKEFSLTLPSTAQINNNVLFKFEFTFDGGNNIYIDDIRIQNPLGVRDLGASQASLNLFPNPTNGNAQMTIGLENNWDGVEILLTDLSGKTVQNIMQQGFLTKGKHQIELNTNELPSGIYFVRMNSSAGQLVEKLVVQ